MAKKKVVEEEVVEVEEVAEEPTEEVAVEEVPSQPELVKVKAHQNFRDGAFKKELEELGYTRPQWNEGEVRLIPARLYFKLQQRSGNKFSLVGGE
jgi:hypothetical protein